MQEVDDIKALVLPMVLQKLDNSGVLGQLKAKMRAQVFEIIDSQERASSGESSLYTNNDKLRFEKENNNLCEESLQLVNQFLIHFNCTNTSKIFLSEANYSTNKNEASREKLANSLGYIRNCLNNPQKNQQGSEVIFNIIRY